MSNANPSSFCDNKENSDIPVKRPMNAFMIFRKQHCKTVRESRGMTTNAELSVQIGQMWKSMTKEQQAPYYETAARLKEEHMTKYPEYKYQPKRKEGKKMAIKNDENVNYVPEEYYHAYVQHPTLIGYAQKEYLGHMAEGGHCMEYPNYYYQYQVEQTQRENVYNEGNFWQCPQQNVFFNHGQHPIRFEHPVMEKEPVELVDEFTNINPTVRLPADYPWEEVYKSLGLDTSDF